METEKSMNYVIRKANVNDVASLPSLCSQLGYPVADEEVRIRLQDILNDDEHAIFIAVLLSGQVVGWVHTFIYKLFYSDFMAEVAGLVVDKVCRKQGIGRSLMEAVESWAKEKDCVAVSLRSNVIRKEAHVFYQNIGYDLVKEQYTFRKRF